MNLTRARSHPAAVFLVLFAGAAPMFAGCSGERAGSSAQGPLSRLSPADFAVDSPAGLLTAPPADAPPMDPDVLIHVDPARTTGPVGASDGIFNITTLVGEPVTPQHASSAVGAPHLVDAKVGDINGKPIFVSTLFDTGSPTIEALGPRLAAEAQQLPPAAWKRKARGIIQEAVLQLTADELLRAEALASLTPQQREGFFNFMQSLRDDLQRRSGGSREQLNKDIERDTGLSTDQFLRQREQRELIGFQLQEKINRRVHVSWRDIAQAYDRYHDQFNPPPKFRFRLIQVPSDRPQDAAEVALKLDAGVPASEIASSALNSYKPKEGGLEVRELKTERAASELFASKPLSDAARTIEPGQTLGPFETGRTSSWLHLESIEQTSIPLYDAQLSLESFLRQERSRTERQRYLEHLISRASVTDLEAMTARLMLIAEERYLPLAARTEPASPSIK